MFRVVGLFAAVAGGGYLAMSGGRIGGVDLTNMPPEMIVFLAATGGLVLGLRYI